MTNFEKIKNMSIDEMVDKFDKVFNCYGCPIREFCDEINSEPNSSCTSVWKEWLKSEVQCHG